MIHSHEYISQSKRQMLCFLVPGFILNSWVLSIFLRNLRRHVTPFTVYVLMNTILEMAMTASVAVTSVPQVIRRGVYLKPSWCDFFKYASWTLPSLLIILHSVICLDRWLALLRPLWYRTKTIKFGLCATFVGFLYHQLWYLPAFIIDSLKERRPNQTCDTAITAITYRAVVKVFTDVLPEAAIVCSYPFLLYRVWRRGAARREQGREQRRSYRVAVAAAPGAEALPDAGDVTRMRTNGIEMRLTICMLVVQMACWVPYSITSSVSNFLKPHEPLALLYVAFATYEFGHILCLLDPIIYLSYFPGLRSAWLSDVAGIRRLLRLQSNAIAP
ncbi:hypothetical protein BV898_14344 [Hypsibius exemplaris]|uniref:G-protein coupled receptors family 1 profile domain-containing protein n=1 Tax=Hypsibius exemplaris TaxID=2072580 RepID=A0A9X6NI41_HYPEX|nr:hypothetical protein BV898_14344 [Hypsibius exemplaris]